MRFGAQRMADRPTGPLTKKPKDWTVSWRAPRPQTASQPIVSPDFIDRQRSPGRNRIHLNPTSVRTFKRNGSPNSSKPHHSACTAGAYFAATHEKSGLSLENYASWRAPNVVATHGTPHVFLPLRPFRPEHKAEKTWGVPCGVMTLQAPSINFVLGALLDILEHVA